MALLWIEGCTEVAYRLNQYWSTSTGGGTTGRYGDANGGWALNAGGQDWTRSMQPAPTADTVVVGLAVNASGFGIVNQDDRMMCFRAATIDHITINLNDGTGGKVTARRGNGGGTILGSSASPIPISTWVYIEAKVKLHDTTGLVQVRVNGTQVINYTGNTRASGTGTVNTDEFRWRTTNGFFFMDDVYCLDTAGSAPLNDFLGDCRVQRLLPNNNGASSQWVGSDGNSTDNYLLVDETPPNTTDYVQSATSGQRDLYEMSDLSATSGTVLATQPVAYGAKSDAGTANIKMIQRATSGTVVASTAVPMSTTYLFMQGDLRTTDPDGSALTIANTNSQQVGVEVG